MFFSGVIGTVCYALRFAIAPRWAASAGFLLFLYAFTITLFFADPLFNRRSAKATAGIYSVLIFGLVAAKRGWNDLFTPELVGYVLLGIGIGILLLAYFPQKEHTDSDDSIPLDADTPPAEDDVKFGPADAGTYPAPESVPQAQENTLIRPLEPSLQKNQQIRKKLFFAFTCVFATLAAVYIGIFYIVLTPSALYVSLLDACITFLAVCAIPAPWIQKQLAAVFLSVGFFSLLWFGANAMLYEISFTVAQLFVLFIGAFFLGCWLKFGLLGEIKTRNEMETALDYSAKTQPLPPVFSLIILAAAALLLFLVLAVFAAA